MAELHLETEIAASAERVFDAIADLRGYDRWLSHEGSFGGTTEITPEPVALGTTYVEHESRGIRRGTVTEFERPRRITFAQPMTLKPKLAGVIDITVRFTLTPRDGSVHVDRDVTLTMPWSLKLVQPIVVRQFRSEGDRALNALKAFVEGSA
jgi:uncharacterized protein YndB with AHSA1/START domain